MRLQYTVADSADATAVTILPPDRHASAAITRTAARSGKKRQGILHRRASVRPPARCPEPKVNAVEFHTIIRTE